MIIISFRYCPFYSLPFFTFIRPSKAKRLFSKGLLESYAQLDYMLRRSSIIAMPKTRLGAPIQMAIITAKMY